MLWRENNILTDEPNIQVLLSDESELHCFKLVFAIAPEGGGERVPLEIFLHTTQAIDLFSQLATQLSAYMKKASAELLEIRSRSLGA